MDQNTIVPIFGIVFLFGAPVAAWVISRVLAHRERIEMIRQGFVPPPDGRAYRQARAWQSGPVPPPPGGIPPMPGSYDNYYAQNQLRKGITLTLIGMALLIGLGSIGPLSGLGYGGPWLLGGLIPMFVGIAQIINAVLNGARFPASGRGPMGYTPHPGAHVPPDPPPPPSGPYAWRPGPTPEIERPSPPPDQR